MKDYKVQSKRDGAVLTVVSEVEAGMITLKKDDGKEIKVSESTFKRYYTRDFKETKLDTPAEKVIAETEKKPKKSDKVKTPTKKETKKEKSRKVVKATKSKPAVKKPVAKKETSKTSFPLRSFWNFVIYGRGKEILARLPKMEPAQKKEMIVYFKANDKDGKHTAWLTKNGIK